MDSMRFASAEMYYKEVDVGQKSRSVFLHRSPDGRSYINDRKYLFTGSSFRTSAKTEAEDPEVLTAWLASRRGKGR